jgi:hypothetical protein
MCISNRQSRRKQNRAALKNNHNSNGQSSVNSPFFFGIRSSDAPLGYSNERITLYCLRIHSCHSIAVCRLVATGESHISEKRSYKELGTFPMVLGLLQIALAMIERQLGSVGLN